MSGKGNKCQNLKTAIAKIAFLPPPFPDTLSWKLGIGPKFKVGKMSFQTSPILS